MSMEVHIASPTDASELTKVFYAAFVGPVNETMFPQTPDVTEWWENDFREGIARSLAGEIPEVFLKVTEGSKDGAVVAFAKWKRPVSADHDRHDAQEPIVWPASSDKELCDRFFNGMEAQHELWMGGRPHYYLDMLGVHPSYKGKGLGSKLLKWGLERADAEGMEAYLSASPEGKPLYERYGFRIVDTYSPYPGYVQSAMIREANKP